MADTNVSLSADLNDLVKAFRKLPNQVSPDLQKLLIKTESTAQKAAEAAKKAVKSSAREQKRAMKEAERAAKKAERAAEKARRETASGLKAMASLGGASERQLTKVGSIFTAMSNPIGLVAVGIGGVVAGLGGIVVGAAAAVLAADDLAKSLEPLNDLEGFEGLPPAALASIQSANNAVSALAAIAKQVVVTLGAEFAPVVDRVAVLLVKFGLMALDAFQAFAEGHNVLRELAVFITDRLVQAFTAPISGLVDLISLLGSLAEAVGADGLAAQLQAVDDAWDGFTRSLAESAVDVVFEAADSALSSLEDSTADYDDRARELIGTVGDLTKEQKGLTAAVKATEDALEGFLDDVGFLLKAERELEAERAFAALEPDNLIPPATIQRMRELGELVDEVVPRETLSELDRLNLLLIDLERVALDAGGANDMLAEQIGRVRDRIEELEPSRFDKIASAAGGAASKIGAAFAAVAGPVGAIIGGIDSFLQTFAGFGFSDIAGAALGGAVDAEGNPIGADEAVTGMIDAGIGMVEAFADNIDIVLDALIEGLPRLVEALVAAVGPIIEAFAEALPDLVLIILRASVDITHAVMKGLINGVGVLIKEIAGRIGPVIRDALSAAWKWLTGAIRRFLAGVFDRIGLDRMADRIRESGHFGRVLGQGMVGDEIPILARAGEAILSPRGVEAVGGASGVDELNLGRPPAAPAAAARGRSVRDTHVAFDDFVKDHLRLNSTLASAVRAGSAPGRVNPYSR